MRLLVTRPAPEGEGTAAALRALGHDVVLMPMLHIEPIADAPLGEGPWSAVLLTSANACRAFAAHKRRSEILHLPAFVVGRRTAAAARAAGFSDVTSADGKVDDLVRLVAGRLPGGSLPLLYLAGEDRAGDLAAALAVRGFAVRTAIVYRAVVATVPPPSLAHLLRAGGVDGVLHFSPRSAKTFVTLAQIAGIVLKSVPIRHYCLSPQVAAPLAAAGAATIEIASDPQEQAMLDLIGRA